MERVLSEHRATMGVHDRPSHTNINRDDLSLSFSLSLSVLFLSLSFSLSSLSLSQHSRISLCFSLLLSVSLLFSLCFSLLLSVSLSFLSRLPPLDPTHLSETGGVKRQGQRECVCV